MGKIRKGVMGGFVGYVGSVSGFNSPGKEMIRTKKSKLKPDNKVSSAPQTSKFKQMVFVWNMIKPMIYTYFESVGLPTDNLYKRFCKGCLSNEFGITSKGINNGMIIIEHEKSDIEGSAYFNDSEGHSILRFDNLAQYQLKPEELKVAFARYNDSVRSSGNDYSRAIWKSWSRQLEPDPLAERYSILIGFARYPVEDKILTNVFFSGNFF